MLTIVTAADLSGFWLPHAKQHLNVDTDDDDQIIERYIRAAIGFVQRRTAKALAPTTYLYTTDNWPITEYDGGWYRGIELPLSPVRSVVSVHYLDEDDAEIQVEEADYSTIITAEGALILFQDTWSVPSSFSQRPDSVRVVFEAGYDDPATSGSGDDPNLHLPAEAELLVLMLTAHWYQNREAVSPESLQAVEISADALLAALKSYR